MVSDVLEAEEVIKRIRKGHGIIEGDLIEELKQHPDLAAALEGLHVNLRNSVKLCVRILYSYFVIYQYKQIVGGAQHQGRPLCPRDGAECK